MIRSIIGQGLRQAGIYSKVTRARRFLADSEYRQGLLDIEKDVIATRRAIGRFMSRGAERADPGKQVLIISMSNLPVLLKFHALLAKALQLRGYTPVILTKSQGKLARRYFPLFGINDVVFWDECVRDNSGCDRIVDGVVKTFLNDKPTIQDIKRWRFRGVSVGKHALSSATRARLRGQFDLRDPETFELFSRYLREAVKSVLTAEKLLAQRPISKMIVRDAGYVPNGGIYEVGLAKGIDALRVEMGQRKGSWLFKRYTADTAGQALFSISPSTWDRLKKSPLTAEQAAELEANFTDRYDPTSQMDVNLYQSGKNFIPTDDVRARLALDPAKQTGVIFAHISWDASFFDGEDLYDDYEQWLVESTRLACANPQLNWIIKLHPANLFKLQRENGVTEETEMLALRRLGDLPPHVRVVHANTEINTRSLFPLIDYCLTVRGTIGMELPCFGIPTLTAGTGRYDGYGFTTDCQSRREYEERVRDLHRTPRLQPEQIEMARRHAYWTLVRRQTSFDDVGHITTRPVGEARHNLHQNLSITSRSLSEFESAMSVKAFSDWAVEGESPDLIV